MKLKRCLHLIVSILNNYKQMQMLFLQFWPHQNSLQKRFRTFWLINSKILQRCQAQISWGIKEMKLSKWKKWSFQNKMRQIRTNKKFWHKQKTTQRQLSMRKFPPNRLVSWIFYDSVSSDTTESLHKILMQFAPTDINKVKKKQIGSKTKKLHRHRSKFGPLFSTKFTVHCTSKQTHSVNALWVFIIWFCICCS